MDDLQAYYLSRQLFYMVKLISSISGSSSFCMLSQLGCGFDEHHRPNHMDVRQVGLPWSLFLRYICGS